MDRRDILKLAGVGALIPAGAASAASEPTTLAAGQFKLVYDSATGALRDLIHPTDPSAMSWISSPRNAPWQSRGLGWGLGYADVGKTALHRGRWDEPSTLKLTKDGMMVSYVTGALKVDVARKIVGETLTERYSFTNTGEDTLPMSDKSGAGLVICAPFNDHYTNARDLLEHRCHTHLWTGGSSAWIATLRMGGRGPHLGLVVAEGGLSGYSITGRDTITSSNTRGTFLLHPSLRDLKPGETRTVAWTLFWHDGWEDFFTKAARHSQQFVRIESSRHTLFPGERADIRVSASSVPTLDKVLLTPTAGAFTGTFTASQAGEQTLRLKTASGGETRLVLNVAPPLSDLMAARARFIVNHQQYTEANDARSGAFVLYDNQLKSQVTTDPFSDRNEARERLGMGVFLARWLRQERVKDAKVLEALERYSAFVKTKLQRPDGFVFNSVINQSVRLYNWPWAAQLHLEMARLLGRTEDYDWFVKTMESYYANGGDSFYAIGLPIYEGLTALKAANRMADYGKLLNLVLGHGRKLAAQGTNYPESEVNYEQSIVGPAAQILLELHRVTGDKQWLEAAKPHVALLELFNGRQPDHHLNEIAIRHWDGYWFGKSRMFGDTFPHYWSGVTGIVFHHYAKATGNQAYARRADEVLRNNLSLFTADGHGSAAYLYPVTVNGQTGRFYDAYANDQDWALVHLLQVRDDG
ncbi:hypothetical protein [Asticcacaulis sp. W401b]|uniref:hypothetical protein n=1 Tax=Asticcacaulis sp. W401b TaxID=3388666 RepID=UPI0039708C67